jgi:hypothetical protein
VLLRDSTRAHGRLIEATPDALSLRRLVGANDVKVIDRTLPLDSVQTIWRRAGTRWRTGAFVGVGAGILGMIVAVGAASDYDDPPCDERCFLGGLLAGVTGGLLGALVGYQFIRWEVVPGG